MIIDLNTWTFLEEEFVELIILNSMNEFFELESTA